MLRLQRTGPWARVRPTCSRSSGMFSAAACGYRGGLGTACVRGHVGHEVAGAQEPARVVEDRGAFADPPGLRTRRLRGSSPRGLPSSPRPVPAASPGDSPGRSRHGGAPGAGGRGSFAPAAQVGSSRPRPARSATVHTRADGALRRCAGGRDAGRRRRRWRVRRRNAGLPATDRAVPAHGPASSTGRRHRGLPRSAGSWPGPAGAPTRSRSAASPRPARQPRSRQPHPASLTESRQAVPPALRTDTEARSRGCVRAQVKNALVLRNSWIPANQGNDDG